MVVQTQPPIRDLMVRAACLILLKGQGRVASSQLDSCVMFSTNNNSHAFFELNTTKMQDVEESA